MMIYIICGCVCVCVYLYVFISGNGSKEILSIPQSSSITETLPSDCLVSYPRPLFIGESYPSDEVQLVYSSALANFDGYVFIYICTCACIWMCKAPTIWPPASHHENYPS